MMIVEDDPLLRMVVAEELRDLGHRVLEASTAEEARQLLRADAPVAVVVSDINLPGANGISLARWLRTEYPDVSVILLSGDPMNADEARKVALFLQKPYPTGALIRLILDALPAE